LDGISVLPTLAGRPQTNRHEFFYWEKNDGGFQQAARMKDWKAMRPNPAKPAELYSLTADLAEKTDLAKEQPEVLKKLEEFLKTSAAGKVP
jgi:arylsulfatase